MLSAEVGGSCVQVQSTNNINVYDMSVCTSLSLSCLIQDQGLTKDSAEYAVGMDKWNALH